MNLRSASPWLVRALYLFGFTLVVGPLLDLVSTVWPLRFTDLSWRYGFLGLAAGFVSTPLLGLIWLTLVAWANDRPDYVRVAGWVMSLAAVLLVVMAGVFLLDVLQMRSMREAQVQGAVLVGGAIQEFKYAMTILVLTVAGIGALRTARGMQRAGRR